VRTHTGTAAWKHKISVRDIFKDDGGTFQQRRDQIVQRFQRAKTVLADGDNGEELAALIEELADSESSEEFNWVWDSIYDLADDGGRKWLWIET